MNTHNWKHAPKDSDAFWKCHECRKLDFNAIPDTDPTCSGNISARIDEECKINTSRVYAFCPRCETHQAPTFSHCLKCGCEMTPPNKDAQS